MTHEVVSFCAVACVVLEDVDQVRGQAARPHIHPILLRQGLHDLR